MDNKSYPKLLVISHNTFSSTLNNGKTYSSIFKGWPKEKIAQLFFQNEIPDFDVCENYYHITDEDMIKGSKMIAGKKIDKSKVDEIKKTISPIHSYARKKPKPIFSFARNLVWSTNKWDNDKLNKWLEAFKPEVIFFVGGSNSFSYKITNKIADKFNIPVYLYFTDDYITPIKTIDPFWWVNYYWLKKELKKLLVDVKKIFVIGEDMGKEFSDKLNKECISIMNAVNIDDYLVKRVKKKKYNNSIELAYFGGLHLNRWKTLFMIADSLYEIDSEDGIKMTINIYTGTLLEEKLLNKFNEHPNINFKGSVTEKEIVDEMQKYDVLVHVESFDQEMISKTRLSISTKIPEYLASGKVLLGVGPSELSSIKYLKKLDFVYIIDKYDRETIKLKLREIANQKNNFDEIGTQGIVIAKLNHSIENNKDIIRQVISKGVYGE